MTTITPTEEPSTSFIRGEGIRRNLLTVMEDEGVCQFMSGPDSKGGSHNRRRIVEGGKREAGKCKEEGGAGKQGV